MENTLFFSQILLLEEYLYNYDTKFLETRTLATLIEEDALIEDIYSCIIIIQILF
jgi:hypothetical protein